MMRNPFRGKNHQVESMNLLYGRARDVQELRQRIRYQLDTLLLGPEGIGKSSLLACAFSKDFRKEMAQNMMLITPPFEYPYRLERDGVFPFLVEQIKSALAPLDDPLENEILDRIRSRMEQHLEPTSMFHSVVNMVHDEWGYSFCLVIDNFERFTTSPDVTMEHHETMRTLLEKGYLRFVVSTNYDLTQDSLPKDVKGSYLLQKFRDCEMLLKGISRPEACRMLKEMSDGQCETVAEQIYKLTGGIPALLLMAAGTAFEILDENGFDPLNEEQWNLVRQDCLYGARFLLEHWCRFLTSDQVMLIKRLAEGQNVPSDQIGPAQVLVRYRGLLLRSRTGRYGFATELLGDYAPEIKDSKQAVPAEAEEHPLPAADDDDAPEALVVWRAKRRKTEL